MRSKPERISLKVKRNSITLLGTLFVFSCQVKIPNIAVYNDQGDLGARKEYILHGSGEDVSKEDWDHLRFGMACTDVGDLSILLGAIEKLCLQTGNCLKENGSEILTMTHRIRSTWNIGGLK